MCWMGRKSSENELYNGTVDQTTVFTFNTGVLVNLSTLAVTLVSGHHSENWLFLTVDGNVVEQMVNPDINSCPWPSLDFVCFAESCCMMLELTCWPVCRESRALK